MEKTLEERGVSRPTTLQEKIYRTIVRSALVYGGETWTKTKSQERRLGGNDIKDAEVDVLSDEERSNQKRTCERIGKSGISSKEDHREKAKVVRRR